MNNERLAAVYEQLVTLKGMVNNESLPYVETALSAIKTIMKREIKEVRC